MAPNLSTLRPLIAGDVILEMKPIIHLVFKEVKEFFCNQCLKKSDSLKKCSKCHQMYYCDKNCQSFDWKYHKNECKVFRHKKFKEEEYCDGELLFLRFWLTIKSDPNFASKRHQLPDGSDISLNDIQIDLNEFSENIDNLVQFRLICNHWTEIGLEFNRKEIFNWFAIVRSAPIVSLLIHNISVKQCLVIPFSGVNVAVGVFPQMSSVCHSCLPNSALISNGISLQLRAMKEISIGSQITASYIDLAQNKTDRHKGLKLFLINDCNCLKCDQNLDSNIDYQKFLIFANSLKQKLKEFVFGIPSQPVLDWNQIQAISEEMFVVSEQIYGRFHQEVIAISGNWFFATTIIKKKNGISSSSADIKLYEKVKLQYEVVFGKSHPIISVFDFVVKYFELI